MLLQVACNQMVMRGLFILASGVGKIGQFFFFFWFMDCRDGGVRMVVWRGVVN